MLRPHFPIETTSSEKQLKLVDSKEYVDQRLDDQIEWYDRKSRSNQGWYKRLRMTQVLAAAVIPFLTGYLESDTASIKLVVGGCGVVIAAVTATLDLYRFQEHWIQYRSTCESLKKEKFLFLTHSEPYNNECANRLELLVQRSETLISKENSHWTQYARDPKPGEE